MKLIDRPMYLERLKNLKGSPDIKIITGIRRAGKSKLIQAYIRFLEEIEQGANIIYIDYTKLSFEHLNLSFVSSQYEFPSYSAVKHHAVEEHCPRLPSREGQGCVIPPTATRWCKKAFIGGNNIPPRPLSRGESKATPSLNTTFIRKHELEKLEILRNIMHLMNMWKATRRNRVKII